MKRLLIPLSAMLALALPMSGFAQSASNRLDFSGSNLGRYSDAPFGDVSTNISVSALTKAGVLLGNDDGTFTPGRTLNRAEFMQIIDRLSDDNEPVRENCFPDVRPSDWFALAVCRGKASGIVRGNAREGIPEAMWRFEPSRDVQYEEAVKVLTKFYALPIVGDEEGDDWYVPFIKAADDAGLGIEGLSPGERITRGEMARLTTAFVAYGTGQLEDFRNAEAGKSSSSSRTSASSNHSGSSKSSSKSSTMSSASSSSHNGSGIFDPLSDTNIRSNILVLGDVSPILGGVKFFSNAEPVDVDHIEVVLENPVASIASLLIYDSDNGELLGTATTQGNSVTYVATIPANRFSLPRREDTSVYVRARTKDEDTGGVSGEDVQIDHVTVSGTGQWSNDDYATTSTDVFDESMTALGVINLIANAGQANGGLVGGTERLIGEFRFTSNSPDSQHDVRFTGLTFSIEQAGGVSLSNVFITVEGSGEEHACTVGATTVTCTGIPASIGTVDDTRTIRVYGDVSVPGGANNPSLRLTLNDPGSIASAGAITWTDDVTVFTWLPLGQPMASGTLYR